MSLDASSALGSSAADALPKPLPGRDTVIQYGMALLTIVLIAAPLLPVLYQSFLDRALYDSGQQLTLGNFGRLRVANELSWDHEVPKLLAAYEAVFETEKKPASSNSEEASVARRRAASWNRLSLPDSTRNCLG